jgi:hypothetical protein
VVADIVEQTPVVACRRRAGRRSILSGIVPGFALPVRLCTGEGAGGDLLAGRVRRVPGRVHPRGRRRSGFLAPSSVTATSSPSLSTDFLSREAALRGGFSGRAAGSHPPGRPPATRPHPRSKREGVGAGPDKHQHAASTDMQSRESPRIRERTPLWGAVRSSAHSRHRPPGRPRGVSRMSEDDVLFGYRLRVLDHAARTSVSEACRVFGIHR